MRITLLCKSCHETEYVLKSQKGKVTFQCKKCGKIHNEMVIGKNELYETSCRKCNSKVFKIRIDKSNGSAKIECRECGEAPNKITQEEPELMVTRAEIRGEEKPQTVEDKELKSLVNDLKNEIIRLKNRVSELERKSEIESKKMQEVKGDYYYLEHIVKKLGIGKRN